MKEAQESLEVFIRCTVLCKSNARESELFLIISHGISEENLLWLLSILIQTKRNMATVHDLLLCKEM